MAPTKNDRVCRFTVQCAGTALYGAHQDYGYSVCGYVVETETSSALVARDNSRSEPRTEPTLELDERTGSARLAHPADDGRWTLTLAWNK